MKIEFWVQGIPQGSRIGARAFQPKGQEHHQAMIYPAGGKDWKKVVREEAKKHKPEFPLAEPVRLALRFSLPLLKSFSKRKVEAIRNGDLYAHTSVPDVKNLQASTEDALKGIIFRDDSYVFSALTEKYYGDPPGCLITVETAE